MTYYLLGFILTFIGVSALIQFEFENFQIKYSLYAAFLALIWPVYFAIVLSESLYTFVLWVTNHERTHSVFGK